VAVRAGLIALAALMLAGCGRTSPGALPDLYAVPDFTLTAQDGREFLSARELKGKVWLGQFIFTTCTGPCPRMATLMGRIQEATQASPDVRFVSFTVDPDNDTPVALAEFGKRHRADFSRWSLLTGSKSALHYLKREVFKLGDLEATLNHSTRLILVDRHMRVRAFPETDDPEKLAGIVANINSLLAE
jgi:protein SCO1/2